MTNKVKIINFKSRRNSDFCNTITQFTFVWCNIFHNIYVCHLHNLKSISYPITIEPNPVIPGLLLTYYTFLNFLKSRLGLALLKISPINRVSNLFYAVLQKVELVSL